MLTLILSALGLAGGLGAAIFFVPALLPALLSLGAALLRCKTCLVAIAIVATFIFADVRRRRIDEAQWKAADVLMQLKAAKRDAAIQADAVALQKKQLTEAEATTAALKKELADYESTTKTACPLGPARANKLRHILKR